MIIHGTTNTLQDNWLNPFPHHKILDQIKLKAFTDNKLNVIKMIIFVFDMVENMVGKGEIACTSNFSFSHNVSKRLLSQMRQKVSLCGNGLKCGMFSCSIQDIQLLCQTETTALFLLLSKHFTTFMYCLKYCDHYE